MRTASRSASPAQVAVSLPFGKNIPGIWPPVRAAAAGGKPDPAGAKRTRASVPGSGDDVDHLLILAALGVLQWGHPVAVGDRHIRARLDQVSNCLHMVGAAIPQNDRLDQSGPAEIVHVVKRRPTGDQAAHDVVMAQMRGSDQRGSVIDAGNQSGWLPSSSASETIRGSSATAAIVSTS